MRWRGRTKRQVLHFVECTHRFRVEPAARALGLDAELVGRVAYTLWAASDLEVAMVAEALARVRYEAARERRLMLDGDVRRSA